jgi:2-polyprenyl-3-methyl-5-hydroxy-6-metoxy-1,4-benzoquinol methylase
MKTEYEQHYHRAEEIHWWFVERRHVVGALAIAAHPDRTGSILEIGCAGGMLIQQLNAAGYRDVRGIDISEKGIALCHERGLKETWVMDAQKPTFADRSFDVITASDVLEHLAEDGRALDEWHRMLKPGGTVIIFVPAFMFLWTAHDEVNRHYRRYRRSELCALLTKHGFEVQRSSYWNFLIFLPVAALRLLRRALPAKESSPEGDMALPPRFINQLLIAWMRIENRLLLAGLRFPWGVSTMVIARRPKASAR